MSNAVPGPGFLMQKGDSAVIATANYTTIAEVGDIKALPLSTDTHDVTNQSSPGGYEEIVPTIRRSGETTFPINFNPVDPTHDEVQGLQADLNNKTLRAWRLIIPGYTKRCYWTGYVTGFDVGAPVNGILNASVKIKVTGAPSWGP